MFRAVDFSDQSVSKLCVDRDSLNLTILSVGGLSCDEPLVDQLDLLLTGCEAN